MENAVFEKQERIFAMWMSNGMYHFLGSIHAYKSRDTIVKEHVKN